MILTFYFSATNCRGWPKLNFYLDGVLVDKLNFSNAAASIKLDVNGLSTGKHLLEIELYNKSRLNTIVEKDSIIQDQTVTLESIYVDDVKFPDFVKYKGTFTTKNQILHPCLTWGLNGKWSFEFDTPIISWVLTCRDQESVYKDDRRGLLAENINPVKTEAMINGLSRLEQILKNVNL